ncbi:MAG: hypothetical protein F6J98_35645, partial [Moorea sp. SIO4G2]|nr:hypothetical protein [Moorena sp. SIO4G2]
MQSLMGETTAIASGGNPQDRAAFPRPRCIAAIVLQHLHHRLNSLNPLHPLLLLR